MKKVSPSVRRIFGLVVAVVAGTLATFVLATPASAHYSSVHGEAACDSATGTFKVTWTVDNSEEDLSATLIKVVLTPDGTTADPIVEGATLPDHKGTLVGVQTVPGDATQATLAVRAHWTDDFEDSVDRVGEVKFGTPCQQDQPMPTASFKSACDGSVVVTLANDAEAKKGADFVVTGDAGFTHSASVAAGGSTNVTVPAASAGNINVSANGVKVATYSWSKPNDCAPVKVSSKSDCTTLTVSLENPAGNTPVDATVTSGSSDPQKVTVAGGETKTVTFPGGPGVTATVTFGAGAAAAAKVAVAAAAAATTPIRVSWEAPEVSCASPPPPNLPVTGTKIGGIIIAGVALVGLGVGLLLFVRRRRTTITPAQ